VADLTPLEVHDKQATSSSDPKSRYLHERSGTVIAVANYEPTSERGFPIDPEIKEWSMPKQSWVRLAKSEPLAVERIGRSLAGHPRRKWPK